MVFTPVFYRLGRWLLIVCGLCITSCSTYRNIAVEILEPAEFTLEGEKRIGYLDRNIRYKDESVVLEENELLTTFYNGFTEALLHEGGIDSVLFVQLNQETYIDQLEFPENINEQTLWSIFLNNKLDYIVSLELMGYHVQELEVVSSWFIKLYSSTEPACVDSISFYVYSNNNWDDLLDRVWQGGREYAYKLVPSWRETLRRVYHKGKVLRLGDYYFRDGDVDKAFDIWYGARQNTKQTIRSRINLAWLYENSGQLELALSVLNEAKRVAEVRERLDADVAYLYEYIAIIQKRIENARIIERQTAR